MKSRDNTMQFRFDSDKGNARRAEGGHISGAIAIDRW